MESGYAFLHPRNAFQATPPGLELEYSPIPFSPWRPCFPALERRIAAVGWGALAYRYTRLAWVFITLPTWIGLVLFCRTMPSGLSGNLGNAILPQRPSWTLWQRITYPLLSRLIWAITFGLPPSASPVTERGIPLLAHFYGRGTAIVPVDCAFASEREEGQWIRGAAHDPAGLVKPQRQLPGFWIRSNQCSTGKEVDTQNSVDVVLYLVGGGYITGHPLEASRVFDMARFSGKPVFGVNYRKSVKREHAFPAALQDTISAYAYLLREGYSRIALAGDSAGAGLALALMQYLARFHDPGQASTRPESLIMPVKACLYSPWADLTFSHDYEEAVHFDIIHKTMLYTAASAYISPAKPSSGEAAGERVTATHSFLSPALSSSLPSLQKIRTVAQAQGRPLPRFLIFYGGAELFHTECKSLCRNLQAAGLPVEEYVEPDEMHGFLLVPTFMSPRILPALQRMGNFFKEPVS